MAATSVPILNTVPADQRVIATNEKVTGPPAIEMLHRSGLITSNLESLEILDNATGGGILIAELLRLASANGASPKISRIVGGDVDDKMLSYVQSRKGQAVEAEHKNWQKVEVMKIDQQSIPLPEAAFTHVFSNFGVFFCQDDEKALQEAHRVLTPSGTAGFTSWKTIAWWAEIAQPAVARFLPDAPPLPSPGQLFPSRGWSEPGAIPAKLEKAGFQDIEISEYNFTPKVEAEEFAEAAGVLVKVVAKRLWSDEDYVNHADQVEPALRRFLQENFEGGKWDGKMTAIISLGKKAQ